MIISIPSVKAIMTRSTMKVILSYFSFEDIITLTTI